MPKHRVVLRKPPKRVYFPGVSRSIEETPPIYRETLRGCAKGEISWPLFVHGDVGVGKTYGALVFLDHVAPLPHEPHEPYHVRREPVFYAKVSEVCDAIMKRDERFLVRMRTARVGVLDEIGCVERVGDLHADAITRFLDGREFYADSVSIMISNLSPERLVSLYDQRIVSRLNAGAVCTIRGEDRRLQL